MEDCRGRRRSAQIFLAGIPVGGGAPISVQTMTRLPARDVAGNLRQIKAAAASGCEIVRVAVTNVEDAEAMALIVAKTSIPVVADVHFNAALAVKSLKNGAACARVNPANLGGKEKLLEVISAAADMDKPLRLGFNAGTTFGKTRKPESRDAAAKAMFEEATAWTEFALGKGFHAFKTSIKSSDPIETVIANRLYAKAYDRPMHLGLTESGLAGSGEIISAAALGSLLIDGIGDTIRISLSGSAAAECSAARRLLVGLGLRRGVRLIVCPGCGRKRADVNALAKSVDKLLAAGKIDATIAVMGCEVNGPGEAKSADAAIASAKNGLIVYRSGEPVFKAKTIEIAAAALMEIIAELNRREPL